jgi:hypothetical protein
MQESKEFMYLFAEALKCLIKFPDEISPEFDVAVSFPRESYMDYFLRKDQLWVSRNE